MSKKIYVGNLSFRTSEEELTTLFEQVGAVESVSIITDRDTGRSKGFGFVSMSDEDAEKAIAAFNGKEIGGRSLTVNEARPMVKREFTSRAGRTIAGKKRLGTVGAVDDRALSLIHRNTRGDRPRLQ